MQQKFPELQPSVLEHLGIEIVGIEAGKVTMTMPVDQRTHQPFGFLHGGASVLLAESAASMGSGALIDLRTQMCFGLEINANHVKSKQSGVVTAEANIIHQGRTTHVWDIKIRDEAGELVCVSRCTVAVTDKR